MIVQWIGNCLCLFSLFFCRLSTSETCSILTERNACMENILTCNHFILLEYPHLVESDSPIIQFSVDILLYLFTFNDKTLVGKIMLLLNRFSFKQRRNMYKATTPCHLRVLKWFALMTIYLVEYVSIPWEICYWLFSTSNNVPMLLHSLTRKGLYSVILVHKF